MPDPRLLTRFGDRYFAFEKPAGMAVHPNAEGVPDLVTWILGQRSLPRSLRPAHRLDRGTSGVVLCGAGGKARAQISAWLEGGARKRYLALVHGVPEATEGRIERPLADARRGRELEACTAWRLLGAKQGLALLELELLTGRKHQLRRHLAAVGHPVVGDARYGRLQVPSGLPERLWLHAWRLELPNRHIQAPPPPELAALLPPEEPDGLSPSPPRSP